MKLSETKILLVGHGLFEIMFGLRFAEDFKKVMFFNPGASPGDDPFPAPFRRDIGEGIPGIEKVRSYEDAKWEILKDDGIFCFLDVGMGDKQREIKRLAKLMNKRPRIFGTGDSEEQELDRELFKRTLKSQGLAYVPYRVVHGIDELVPILKKEDDLWIKLNTDYRGIKETFKHTTWKESKTAIDELACKLSFLRDTCTFMIEKNIPGVEPGGDWFVSRGILFSQGLYGWEDKGISYLCKVMDTDKMPAAIRTVNQAMAPVYRKYGIDGALSTEIRLAKDRIPRYIDACQRMGNPPAATICAIYKNSPKIIAGIADGEAVKPEFEGAYGAEIGVESSEAETRDIPFDFNPQKDSKTIKLRLATKINGQFFNVKSNCGTTIVKAVGIGKSKEEAIYNCLEAADGFHCQGKSYDKSSFDSLEDSIREGEKYGLGTF